MTYSKIIELERGWRGDVQNIKETTVAPQTHEPVVDYEPFSLLTEAKAGDRTVSLPLHEAFLLQPDAGNILRNDIRYIAFSTYAGIPRVWEPVVRMETSRRLQEEYLRDATIGVLPQVASGDEAPQLLGTFEGGVIIKNFRYAGIISVTGDMIRFDQLGKIRQIAAELGRSARMTEEHAFWSYITTAGNYTRNSTTNDNDVGANQADTTFNALGLDTGLTTISTAKDRKSGAYLGYAADTILCGPKMEFPVKQMLLGGDLARSHGATSAEVRGMGSYNPYQGLLSRIIVSPWFGASYGWALCDSRALGLVWQTVEPFNVYQESQNATSEAWLTRDTTRFLTQGYFGLGFVDDRAWFLSTSSTAPTVS